MNDTSVRIRIRDDSDARFSSPQADYEFSREMTSSDRHLRQKRGRWRLWYRRLRAKLHNFSLEALSTKHIVLLFAILFCFHLIIALPSLIPLLNDSGPLAAFEANRNGDHPPHHHHQHHNSLHVHSHTSDREDSYGRSAQDSLETMSWVNNRSLAKEATLFFVGMQEPRKNTESKETNALPNDSDTHHVASAIIQDGGVSLDLDHWKTTERAAKPTEDRTPMKRLREFNVSVVIAIDGSHPRGRRGASKATEPSSSSSHFPPVLASARYRQILRLTRTLCRTRRSSIVDRANPWALKGVVVVVLSSAQPNAADGGGSDTADQLVADLVALSKSPTCAASKDEGRSREKQKEDTSSKGAESRADRTRSNVKKEFLSIVVERQPSTLQSEANRDSPLREARQEATVPNSSVQLLRRSLLAFAYNKGAEGVNPASSHIVFINADHGTPLLLNTNTADAVDDDESLSPSTSLDENGVRRFVSSLVHPMRTSSSSSSFGLAQDRSTSVLTRIVGCVHRLPSQNAVVAGKEVVSLLRDRRSAEGLVSQREGDGPSTWAVRNVFIPRGEGTDDNGLWREYKTSEVEPIEIVSGHCLAVDSSFFWTLHGFREWRMLRNEYTEASNADPHQHLHDWKDEEDSEDVGVDFSLRARFYALKEMEMKALQREETDTAVGARNDALESFRLVKPRSAPVHGNELLAQLPNLPVEVLGSYSAWPYKMELNGHAERVLLLADLLSSPFTLAPPVQTSELAKSLLPLQRATGGISASLHAELHVFHSLNEHDAQQPSIVSYDVQRRYAVFFHAAFAGRGVVVSNRERELPAFWLLNSTAAQRAWSTSHPDASSADTHSDDARRSSGWLGRHRWVRRLTLRNLIKLYKAHHEHHIGEQLRREEQRAAHQEPERNGNRNAGVEAEGMNEVNTGAWDEGFMHRIPFLSLVSVVPPPPVVATPRTQHASPLVHDFSIAGTTRIRVFSLCMECYQRSLPYELSPIRHAALIHHTSVLTECLNFTEDSSERCRPMRFSDESGAVFLRATNGRAGPLSGVVTSPPLLAGVDVPIVVVHIPASCASTFVLAFQRIPRYADAVRSTHTSFLQEFMRLLTLSTAHSPRLVVRIVDDELGGSGRRATNATCSETSLLAGGSGVQSVRASGKASNRCVSEWWVSDDSARRSFQRLNVHDAVTCVHSQQGDDAVIVVDGDDDARLHSLAKYRRPERIHARLVRLHVLTRKEKEHAV